MTNPPIKVDEDAKTVTLLDLKKSNYFNVFKFVGLPLIYRINAIAGSTCDFARSIGFATPIILNKTVSAYVQIYDNICEVFDLQRNETHYLDNKFSLTAYSD